MRYFPPTYHMSDAIRGVMVLPVLAMASNAMHCDQDADDSIEQQQGELCGELPITMPPLMSCHHITAPIDSGDIVGAPIFAALAPLDEKASTNGDGHNIDDLSTESNTNDIDMMPTVSFQSDQSDYQTEIPAGADQPQRVSCTSPRHTVATAAVPCTSSSDPSLFDSGHETCYANVWDSYQTFAKAMDRCPGLESCSNIRETSFALIEGRTFLSVSTRELTASDTTAHVDFQLNSAVQEQEQDQVSSVVASAFWKPLRSSIDDAMPRPLLVAARLTSALHRNGDRHNRHYSSINSRSLSNAISVDTEFQHVWAATSNIILTMERSLPDLSFLLHC